MTRLGQFLIGDRFLPRWDSDAGWQEHAELGWLHVAADLVGAVALLFVAAWLAYYLIKGRDVVYARAYWLFCGLFAIGGLIHLTEAVSFWAPVYQASGLLKLAIAVLAVYTVVALRGIVSSALALPSRASVNKKLEDETEQRMQIEKEWRHTKERLELAVAGATDGLWYWETDSEYVWYAPRFIELVGYEQEEFPYKLESFNNLLHPDDFASTWEAVNEHLSKGRPYDVEYRLLHKGGAYRWFRARGAAIQDELGNPTRMAGSIQDITEKKQAEMLLGGVVENADAAISVKDELGRCILVNEYFANLIDEARPWAKTGVDEETYEALVVPLKQAEKEVLATGENRRFEEGIVVDGVNRTFISTSFPLCDAENKVVAVGSISTDVTDLKRTQKRLQDSIANLQKANEDLDSFAYIASHDLKSPLRAIENISKWISEDAADVLPEKSREHFEMLQARVRRMETLLNDLLDYSRAGRVGEDLKQVDVATMVHDIRAAIDWPAEMELVLSDDLPKFETAAATLQRVFLNLMTNAVKYRQGPRPRLEISSRLLGDFVEFTASDNGMGIAPQYHETVFQMFKRLHNNSDIEGTGMGLALIKKIVESHGGEISLESREGAGSTFRFTWPLKIKARPKATADPPAQPAMR